MGSGGDRDHVKWANHVDFVANDHYVTEVGLRGRDELSFSANFVSAMARGKPWWLMETSTSAVNWQAINTPKAPGEMAWHALSHVAQGADAVCYFQWRQSRGGGETWHSSMVPHAGEDSRLFRNVCALGETLKKLEKVQHSTRCKAQVALLIDYESWWTSEFDSHPSNELKYQPEALDWYIALLDAGYRVDILPAHRITNATHTYDWAELEAGYKLVIAPILHQVSPDLAYEVTRYVSRGGHFVTTFFSGIINDNVQVYLGGYPGAFRDVLGIRVEEMGPLPHDQVVKMDHGAEGKLWCEPVDIVGKDVKVLRTYKDGLYPGQPAVTLNQHEKGWAVYVSTQVSKGRAELVREFAEKAGVEEELSKNLRGKVDYTIRENEHGRWAFYISRSSDKITLKGAGVKGSFVVSTAPGGVSADWELHPRGVAVIKLE
jgi:beta-galactosidase